jgi:hypothetical protein
VFSDVYMSDCGYASSITGNVADNRIKHVNSTTAVFIARRNVHLTTRSFKELNETRNNEKLKDRG